MTLQALGAREWSRPAPGPERSQGTRFELSEVGANLCLFTLSPTIDGVLRTWSKLKGGALRAPRPRRLHEGGSTGPPAHCMLPF